MAVVNLVKNLLLKRKSEYINEFLEIFFLIYKTTERSFLEGAVGGFKYNKILLNLNTLINYKNDGINLE